MLLAPIIFASVVVGIARMSNLHEAGRSCTSKSHRRSRSWSASWS
jgi:Na+/H+-dicarboxylate symporter